ncbi:MAG: ABC transporter substrate-binding protein [Alphaproteobacteria bacterium]|nr:ABC transporter substrate-binding protein [Alphaproteobacteria bacterium]
MKKIFVALSVLFAVVSLNNDKQIEVYGQQQATEMSRASYFVEELANKALAKVKEPNISMTQVVDYFWILLDEYFAIKSIAILSLKLYWKQMNAEQKEAFIKHLRNMLARTYSSKFVDFKNAQCQISGEREKTQRMKEVLSSIKITDKEYKVIWTYDSKQNKIVDVSVDGVSILQSLTDVTQSAIAKKKLSVFLAEWKQKYENLHPKNTDKMGESE